MKIRYPLIYRFLVALSIITAVIIMSSCVTEYEKDDIENMLKEMGVKGAVVSDTFEEVEGEDGYIDKIWKITVPETGVEFHVIDDFHWGMEAVTNSLKTDYNEAVLNMIKDQLPVFEHLHVQTGKENDIFYGQITGEFKNRNELKENYLELEEIKEAFDDLGYKRLSVSFRLQHIHPLRNVTEYVIDDADYHGKTDSLKPYKDVLNEYITAVLDYRYDNEVESFTEDEISEALTGYKYRAGIYRGSQTDKSLYEEEMTEYYDDIIANKYSYGISFGSLYEILLREGVAPYGNNRHFTFTGSGGNIYEISYDFNYFIFEDDSGIRNGYYYKKNGEKIPMGCYFYNHFTTDQIFEMTGLRLVDHSEE